MYMLPNEADFQCKAEAHWSHWLILQIFFQNFKFSELYYWYFKVSQYNLIHFIHDLDDYAKELIQNTYFLHVIFINIVYRKNMLALYTYTQMYLKSLGYVWVFVFQGFVFLYFCVLSEKNLFIWNFQYSVVDCQSMAIASECS